VNFQAFPTGLKVRKRVPAEEAVRELRKGNTEMYRKPKNPGASILFMVLCFGLPPATQAQDNVSLFGASPAANFAEALLKRTDVQNELGIDANQKQALAKVLSESNAPEIVRTYPDISRLSDEERKQWQAEINRQANKDIAFLMNEHRREVEGVLRPDQRKRLTELDLQWRGILALVDQGLSDELGILPSHYKVIEQIVNAFEVKRITLSFVRSRVDRYEKRQVLLRETEQKVLAVLSDEEKGRWAEAIGKPFKFDNLIKF
jgi:hypothetical protein